MKMSEMPSVLQNEEMTESGDFAQTHGLRLDFNHQHCEAPQFWYRSSAWQRVSKKEIYSWVRSFSVGLE
jgi:hypothetical protein